MTNDFDRKQFAQLINVSIPSSLSTYQKAKQVFPGGDIGCGIPLNPSPIFMKSAKGAFINDIDGNKYIDCHMGFGSLLFGHNHVEINEALIKQIQQGVFFGANFSEQVELGKKFTQCVPCANRMILCNSGTEAVNKAIAIARAYTGKDKIAKFEGSYHGNFDQGAISVSHVPNEDPLRPTARPFNAGTPRRAVEETIVLPFNNRFAIDLIKQNADELAAVIFEPMLPNCFDSDPDILSEIREITREENILLIFDEVITGFRLALDGAQSLYDFTPDIATYGKVLGAGTTIGAIGTDWKFLKDNIFASPPLRLSGTFSGNPLTVSASNCLLSNLIENHESVYAHINSLGEYFREEFNNFCKNKKYPALAAGIGSIFHILALEDKPKSLSAVQNQDYKKLNEFFLRLLNSGVFVGHPSHSGFFSTAHTVDIVDELLELSFNALNRTFG